MTDLELWYQAPAGRWTEALPIGNGRLGAMVFGGIGREELQLNESTLWSGGPYQPVNPEALPNLTEVRELIFAGRHAEAQSLADARLLARPHLQMSYQPAGNLFLEFPHEAIPGSYRRSLDLDTAIATSSYRLLGTGISEQAATFTRETFVSAADDVLVTRIESSRPAALSFELWLDSPQPGEWIGGDEASLDYRGVNFGEHGIEGRLGFGIGVDLRLEGGTAERRGRRLVVRGATAATLLVDVATSFVRFDDVSGDVEARLAYRRRAVATKSFDDLRAAHLAEHRRLFRRFAIDLGRGRPELPTDDRIARSGEAGDAALAALYVQYGRYLMIASSRPGTQPANLQGIWNDQTRPPWGSKYTANINVQMNYWLSDPANLEECFEPLIGMVEDLTVTGAAMAREHYGAGGWVLHHNTDLWRASGPIDGAQWGVWPSGGAWLCAQLWDHAAYAGYPEPLVRRLLPLIAGAVRFALDTLQPLPGTGYLVTVPSLSPENIHPQGATLCAGPTMDNQILRDLFDAYVDAAARLGLDDPMLAEARAARAKLPPHRIGHAGQLQEWLDDWDMDAPEIHHRHVSHLYGLYPSRQIAIDATPDLAAAAQRSLEIRGDEATGWGIGWRINLWARLRDGDHAHRVVEMLLSPDRTYPNMFDAHPPFQIDGNFGGATGILEMLVQSDGEELHLLPALPSAWPEGSLRGVRARGGLELDLQWSKFRLTALTVRSPVKRTVRVRSGDWRTVVEVSGGAPLVLDTAALA